MVLSLTLSTPAVCLTVMNKGCATGSSVVLILGDACCRCLRFAAKPRRQGAGFNHPIEIGVHFRAGIPQGADSNPDFDHQIRLRPLEKSIATRVSTAGANFREWEGPGVGLAGCWSLAASVQG